MNRRATVGVKLRSGLAVLVFIGSAAGCDDPSTSSPASSGSASPAAAKASSAPSSSAAPGASASTSPGLDASRPELAPSDAGFVDSKAGWGWSDRCWKSLHEGKLGFAKAQCAEGLKIAKADGSRASARPSLLYNLGLIAERAANKDEAKTLFEQSLALRYHPEVAAALTRVGGSPACRPCATQEDFDAAMKAGSKCCPVTTCRGAADCSGGRVCCKIPDGTLCGDEARCTGVNRVEEGVADAQRDASCRRICPADPSFVTLSHCYCVCMGACPP